MLIFGIPVRAHEMSAEEFMGTAKPMGILDIPDDHAIHERVQSLDMTRRESVHEVTDGYLDPCSDYWIAPFRDGRGCALVSYDDDDIQEVVGIYKDSILLVLPRHRGGGLGAFLVLAAASLNGGAIHPRELTVPGYRAHRNAHAMAIAIAANRDYGVTSASPRF